MSCDAMPYVPVRNEVTARKKKRRKQKEAVRRMHKRESNRQSEYK